MITDADIIKRPVSQLFEEAEERAEKLGKLRDSIRGGEGNKVGFTGQLLVRDYLQGTDIDNFNFDVGYNRKRLEIKTKETTVDHVLLKYSASVAAANIRQETDYYVFVRANMKLGLGFIVGQLGKTHYFKIATLLKKGDYDPDNKYTVKADCYNVLYNQLNPIADLMPTTVSVGGFWGG